MKSRSTRGAFRRRAALWMVCVAALGCRDPSPPTVIRWLPRAGIEDWKPVPGDLVRAPFAPSPDAWERFVDPSRAESTRQLLDGWSLRPPSDVRRPVWSLGPASRLRFHLDAGVRAAGIRFEVRCRAFGFPGAGPQVVTVQVNGETAGAIEPATSFGVHELTLAPELLREGWNVVSLSYARVDRPIDVLAESTDTRELAVAFDWIRLRAFPAGAPAAFRTTNGEEIRGIRVGRSGRFGVLMVVPPGARFEGGWLTWAGEGRAPDLRARIEIEHDGGREALWHGNGPSANGMRPERVHVDLSAFEGRAVRLRFEVEGLPEGWTAWWTRPRIHAGAPVAAPGPRPSRHNVVLIVLDATTRDRLGLHGHDRETTPSIDALAGESLVFDRAYSQAVYTLASTGTLFTSRLPGEHGAVGHERRLDASLPTLAEVLRDAGYATAAFSANPFVSPKFGMERGFERFEELYRGSDVAGADELTDAALAWVDQVAPGARSGEAPFFAYLHYLQPHEPYGEAPRGFYRGLDPEYAGRLDGSVASQARLYRGEVVPDEAERRHLTALYEGNLRFADAEVGRLVARLRELELLDRSVVVVTSDHGEGLGERGVFGHNWSLDEVLAAIPLLVRLPEGTDLRGRSDAPAASIDIAPTILAALGLAAPGFGGRNLLGAWEADAPARIVSARSAHDPPGVALWLGPFKYVRHPLLGARRLTRGPTPDAAEDVTGWLAVMFDLLDAARESIAARARGVAAPRPSLSEDTRAALRALGYLAE